jgi:cardiolipin synthase
VNAVVRRIPRRLRRVREEFIEGNRVGLLHDGKEAFPSMLEAIDQARRQILLEMYWFDSDTVGRRFADALMRAVARGVEVAVLYDSVGSWDVDAAFFAELERARIKVVEYNPIKPWRRRFRIDRLTRRDHRKILVVDGRVGFTGGINLAKPWLPEEQGGGGWRDDMVKVRGPAVRGLASCFFQTWTSQGGEPLTVELGGRESDPPGEQRVRVLGATSLLNRREIRSAYLVNIYRAKRRIWMSNSYFVPDRSVMRGLRRAARHGVDVRVLVPGTSDVEIVRYASRGAWTGLMKSGVRIFEWNRKVLHSKSAVIDGHWSTVGTFNLDYWSLLRNLEVNVAVLDSGFGARLEAVFERDFALASEVDPEEFRRRPLRDRLLELAFYRVRKLL